MGAVGPGGDIPEDVPLFDIDDEDDDDEFAQIAMELAENAPAEVMDAPEVVMADPAEVVAAPDAAAARRLILRRIHELLMLLPSNLEAQDLNNSVDAAIGETNHLIHGFHNVLVLADRYLAVQRVIRAALVFHENYALVIQFTRQLERAFQRSHSAPATRRLPPRPAHRRRRST